MPARGNSNRKTVSSESVVHRKVLKTRTTATSCVDEHSSASSHGGHRRRHRCQSSYIPRTCQLCHGSTDIFWTRSGLSKHAVKQHRSWYRPSDDSFIRIPDHEFRAAREKTWRDQQYHCPGTTGPSSHVSTSHCHIVAIPRAAGARPVTTRSDRGSAWDAGRRP